MSNLKQFDHNLQKAKRQHKADRKIIEEKIHIEDVLNAGFNLEPIHCVFCDGKEVVFNQYIGDASCQDCGEWQLD